MFRARWLPVATPLWNKVDSEAQILYLDANSLYEFKSKNVEKEKHCSELTLKYVVTIQKEMLSGDNYYLLNCI